MKKILFFAAVLSVAFTSCMNEEFIGDNSPTTSQGTPGAIGFNLNIPAVTRLDKSGGEAATDLSNQFIVYAEKDETADGAAPVTDGSTTHQLVFKNYVVKWTNNSEYTTTSNTKGWEYVGYTFDAADSGTDTEKYATYITPNSGQGVRQEIKYWDYGAASYTFTAVSALPADITAGKVTITKKETETTGNKVYDKGYTLALTASAHPENIYIADRVVISRSNNSDRTATNTYGGNVTFKFRNLLSHVRVGMYETIPGYSVKIDKFYYKNDGTPSNFADMIETGHTANSTTAFVANASNVGTSSAANLTVKYWNSAMTGYTSALENHPTVTVSDATVATALTLGTNIPGNVLGVTPNAAIFDQSTATYTPFFPQETNNVPLKLMVDYTLTAPVTGETIKVKGATAEIPAEYLRWKPNYKYTYLFKISPNSNGQTGPGITPAGLYPITFDAVEIVAEDGTAEYITTVSEPTITTFGVDSEGKYVKAGITSGVSPEPYAYPAGSDIYATIMEGNTVITPALTGTVNVNLYKNVVSSDPTNFPVTEASLAEAIAETGGSAGEKITYTNDNTIGTVVSTVPGEDGVNVTIDAVKMTALAAGTYAVEYITTQTYYTTSGTHAFADEAAFDAYVAANGTLCSDEEGTTPIDYTTYSSATGATYYTRGGIKKHAKTYKIIVVK